MKKVLFLFALITGLMFSNTDVKASHCAGGELTYEWVSGTTYKFTLKFYRDCTGIQQPWQFSMCYMNTCNSNVYNVTLDTITTLPSGLPNGSPVPTGCPQPTKCNNLSSTIPGFREWWYQGLVTLPAQCSDWEFWVCESARNPQNNITGGNLYIKAMLNNLVAQGNTSPNFSFKPVPYICNNQLWTYNNGAYDVNGDSLSYNSIVPYTGNPSGGGSCTGNYPPGNVTGSFGTYNAATNPFPGTGATFGINPQTGIINAFPTLVGQDVITIEVSEWRNGVLIGKVLRDIQVAIVNCNIPSPTALLPQGAISNLTFDINTLFYEACIGQQISYCLQITGPIDTSNISSINNAAFGLPGSVTTSSGAGTDSVLICTTWTPTNADTGLHVITYQFKDTNCIYNPIAVINSFSMSIYVIPITKASNDTSICFGSSANLNVTGGSNFTWHVLPGGSPITSMNCTNCSQPVVSPTVTTSYVVTSNLQSLCGTNVDTVLVTVSTQPTVTAGPSPVLCLGSVYTMEANINPAVGNYSYSWSPATYLSATNVLNPVVTNPLVDQIYTLSVVSNGVSACKVSSVMTVNVLNGFDILKKDTTMCFGDTDHIFTKGSTFYKYSWLPSTGVYPPNIQNPSIVAPTTTYYSLTASHAGCPDSVQTIKISVEQYPIVNVGPDRSICAGDTIRFNPTINPNITTPSNFYSYLWSPSTHLNYDTILDPFFNGIIDTQMILTVKTPKGCSRSDTMDITVYAHSLLANSYPQEMCPGDTATLKASGGVSYKWEPSMWLNNSVGDSLRGFPISTTIYTVSDVDGHGCKDTYTVSLFIAPNAQVFLGADTTIYPGGYAQLYAQGNCSSWSWSPSIGLNDTTIINPQAQPSVSTKYIVIATTDYGCVTEDTIIVNVVPQSIIRMPNAFSPGNGSSTNDRLKPYYLGLATLNYFRVYDRWGVKVYESNNINDGWNGRLNETPQPMGTYIYEIDAIDNTGKHFTKTGNVTLLR